MRFVSSLRVATPAKTKKRTRTTARTTNLGLRHSGVTAARSVSANANENIGTTGSVGLSGRGQKREKNTQIDRQKIAIFPRARDSEMDWLYGNKLLSEMPAIKKKEKKGGGCDVGRLFPAQNSTLRGNWKICWPLLAVKKRKKSCWSYFFPNSSKAFLLFSDIFHAWTTRIFVIKTKYY